MNALVRNSSITLATRSANAIVQIALQFGIALFLAPAEQGTYYAFLQVAIAAALLSSPGLGQAAIYYLQKKTAAPAAIITSVPVFILLWAPLLIFGLQALAPLLHLNTLIALTPRMFLMALISGMLSALYQEGRLLSLGAGFKLFFNAVHPVTLSLNVVLFLILGRTAPTFQAAVWAYIVSVLCGGIATYVKLFSAHPPSLQNWRGALPARLRFGLLAWSSMIIAYVNYRIAFFMVRRSLGEESSGYYSMAIMLAELVWFVPDAVILMLYPEIAGRTDRESDEYCPAVSRHTFFLASVFMVFVLAAGSLFLHTYGRTYLPAYPAFLLLVPGAFIFTLGKIVGIIFLGRRKLWISNLAALGMFLITISGNLFLIPRFGINGAAMVSTAAYAAGALFGLLYYRRMTGTPLTHMLILRTGELSLYRNLINGFIRQKDSSSAK
jgi:O-antigen/teichoic acid export membrane protein